VKNKRNDTNRILAWKTFSMWERKNHGTLGSLKNSTIMIMGIQQLHP